ncbi:MAG: phosphotransferase [Phototrophicaceae bacterium]|jgi:hypothetical protein
MVPVFEQTNITRYHLEQALRLCGLPLTVHPDAFALEGEGAWHIAYRVSIPQHAHPFIVRIRKPAPYGQLQTYADHAAEWHAEYLSTSLYYRQANRIQPYICPTVYLYHVSEAFTCTVESYMGAQLDLSTLDRTAARRYGRQIGAMSRGLHQKKTHIIGAGEFGWDGANLYGKTPIQSPRLLRQIEHAYHATIFAALSESGLSLDLHSVRDRLSAAHRLRDIDEPTVLINRDISPENLTLQADGRVGVIDPYTYLGNGTRFAAWFIHCYRFLLPAYASTPRYRDQRYDDHAETLAHIADGFERSYTGDDDDLLRHITAECWLWTLEQAYDDYTRLTADGQDARSVFKHGDAQTVRRRLMRSLRQLEMLDF